MQRDLSTPWRLVRRKLAILGCTGGLVVSMLTLGLAGLSAGPALASATPPITVISSLSSANGLAFDSFGDLFIANYGNGTVSVMPHASGTIFGVSVTADTLATFASGLSNPYGLAFDS